MKKTATKNEKSKNLNEQTQRAWAYVKSLQAAGKKVDCLDRICQGAKVEYYALRRDSALLTLAKSLTTQATRYDIFTAKVEEYVEASTMFTFTEINEDCGFNARWSFRHPEMHKLAQEAQAKIREAIEKTGPKEEVYVPAGPRDFGDYFEFRPDLRRKIYKNAA